MRWPQRRPRVRWIPRNISRLAMKIVQKISEPLNHFLNMFTVNLLVILIIFIFSDTNYFMFQTIKMNCNVEQLWHLLQLFILCNKCYKARNKTKTYTSYGMCHFLIFINTHNNALKDPDP